VDSSQSAARTATPPSTPAPSEAEPAPAPRSATDLLELSQVDLYQLFRRSSPGEIPSGRGRGTPIIFPGTGPAKPAAKVLGTAVWRGKVFRPQSSDLKNLLSVLAIPAIRARVYRQASWLDGEECIVLDYTQTSRVCGWIRDEIREVSPALYLGLVYGLGRPFGGRRLLDVSFALSFQPATGTS
jgi:hypothetical protein